VVAARSVVGVNEDDLGEHVADGAGFAHRLVPVTQAQKVLGEVDAPFCPATIKMGTRDNQDGNLVAGLVP
jgi:hypothetical protein